MRLTLHNATYNIMTGDGEVEVAGYTFRLDKIPKVIFEVHRNPDGKWKVGELSTGCSITELCGRTRQDAINIAVKLLESKTLKRVYIAISKWSRLNNEEDYGY